MFQFLLSRRFLQEWEDFFPGTAPNMTNDEEGEKVNYFLNIQIPYEGYSVKNCFFYNLHDITGSAGGAITYVALPSLFGDLRYFHFLVEFCSFEDCISKSTGGAINYGLISETVDSQFVLSKTCLLQCDAQTAPFISSQTSATENSYTAMLDCTFSRVQSNNQKLIIVNNGILKISNTNISKNNCVAESALHYAHHIESANDVFSIKFSSISNNTAYGYTCIKFSPATNIVNKGHGTFTNCNLMYNYHGGFNTIPLFDFSMPATFSTCCIYENTATYLFGVSEIDQSIVLDNCYLDAKSLDNPGIGVSIINTPYNHFVNELLFSSTGGCDASPDYFPFIPTRSLPSALPTKTETPSKPPSNALNPSGGPTTESEIDSSGSQNGSTIAGMNASVFIGIVIGSVIVVVIILIAVFLLIKYKPVEDEFMSSSSEQLSEVQETNFDSFSDSNV